MNKIILICLSVLISSFCFGQKYFKIGKQTCIVIDQNPSDAAKLGSVELQFFIKKVTGLQLPIVTQLPLKASAIYVGESSYTQKLNLPDTELKEQEYLIDITASRIVLLGYDKDSYSSVWQNEGRDNNGITPEKDRLLIDYAAVTGENETTGTVTLPSIYDPQGTCYAVYDFLEKYLDVRFYGPHPMNVVISEKKELKIPAGSIKRAPAMSYRHGTYTLDWPIIKDQYFTSTGDMQQLFLRRIRFGGTKWAANHAFTAYQDRFLTKNTNRPELFESSHPEFFAAGRSGGPSERQFCYTNSGFIKQVAQDAVDYFQGKGLKGEQIAIGDYFAVVPLDNATWCKCDECQKQLALDAGNVIGEHFNCGTATHYLWTFVNNVAKEVRKSCPEGKIAALSYHVYAYRPEDIQLEKNVSVAPCLQPRNYWAPKIKENEIKFYKEWITESKESGRDVFLWNYLCFPTERGLITNFGVFPGFNIHEVGNNIKMYAQDGVKGVFLCGIGEQLDFYITMKLYDNPELDIDELIRDFFVSYFGNAAQPMQQFYTKIESVYSSPSSYPQDIQTKDAQYHQTEALAWTYLGTDNVMNELQSYMNEAEKLAKTETERQRVQSWKTGVWEYMQKGKAAFLKKQGK